jgi:AraC-like DNA-binding protein
MSSSSKSNEPVALSSEREPEWTRGILNPAAEGQRFTLSRLAPSAAVSALVDRYWCVRWAFDAGDSYLTETLPYPCVNVVFERGATTVNGIFTRRWSRTLVGQGRVFGVKFQPGAFAAFYQRPIHQLTDRVLPIAEVFGSEGSELERALLAEQEDKQRARVFERFLMARLPAPDAERERIRQVVDLALATPSLRRVDELARAAAIPKRTLQRLFRRYLGVTPKWMLCRFRIQEAAQRVVAGDAVDWAALAAALGYFDQAHFASDFKAQIGKTPSEYAAFARAPSG